MTGSDRRAIMKGIEDCRPACNPPGWKDDSWSCIMIPPEPITLHSVIENYTIELVPLPFPLFGEGYPERHRGGTAIRFKEFDTSEDISANR